VAILLFPVIGCCRNHLGALPLNSSWSKTQNWRWNFDAIYHSSREISNFGLCGHNAISGCRSFSQSLSLNPRVQLETNKFVVLLLKLVGAFLPPSATRVHKNRSAIRGLRKCQSYWQKFIATFLWPTVYICLITSIRNIKLYQHQAIHPIYYTLH